MRILSRTLKTHHCMKSLDATRPAHANSRTRNFRVAARGRFGRAPRILPAARPVGGEKAKREARSAAQKAFDGLFTRMAHRQRFRAVSEAIKLLGDVTERVCRSYATYSDSHGNQFAVIKPLSDGGLRIGVGEFADIDQLDLDPASGLGSSSRINRQFELASYEVISGRHIAMLRKAFAASAE